MIVIMRAEQQHLEAITNIDELSDPTNKYSLEIFKREIEDENRAYFVAILGQKIVGYVGVFVVYNYPEQAEVLKIAVSNEHRKKGIAMQLLNYALDYLKQLGVVVLHLEVNVNNAPAIALYEKLGFTTIRKSEKYYSNGDDAFIMQLTL